MPSRSFSRGRKRFRSRSRAVSRGRAGPVASRSGYRGGYGRRIRPRVRVQGAHTFSRRCAAIVEEMNGLYLARMYELSFSDLLQSSDFANMFDQYRITKITYSVQLITNPDAAYPMNGTGTSGTINPSNWFPKVWYVVDHDGGPTETISTIKERQGVRCRILQPNKEIRISFQPKCRTLTYSTSTSTGYAPRNIKIDMSDINVEHYGLQMVFDSNGLDPQDSYPFRINIERKVYFTCYGVR